MISEWREYRIDDIADVIGGSTPSTKDPSNFDGDIPWLTPKDLSQAHERYVSRGERNLSRQGLANCSAQLLPTHTVLLSSRAPIGYVAIAKNPIATNQGFRNMILKPGYVPEFIYYWLRANTEELERHASGSTFRELSGSALKQIQIRIPDESNQHAIAHILGTLDDKIELNRRMSETLEAMARALFKSWFVNFDPVRDKAEGRLPAGRQATPASPHPGVWFVYALECDNGSIYIGHTEDVERRFEEHRQGKGADWTKRHPPRRIAYWEEQPSQSAAIAREKKLKTGSGREWLKAEIGRRDLLAPGLPQPLADLFPNRLVDSELGEIPEGWEIKKLSDLCSTQYGYTASAVDEPVGPKLLRVKDINKRNWIEWGDVPHCRMDPGAKERYALEVGDLVVARMADPGKSAIIEENVDAVFASYLVRLKTKSLAHSYYLHGFLKSELYAEYAEGARSGSVQANMNAKVIVGANLPVPTPTLMEQSLRVILPLRQRLVSNVREARTLAALRDALLPKLISGELRVREAEQRMKEVEL
ncbi:MAG: restriction endonuclease subunit S [bacterium]|nr:restriction endonuclease subunit S [bacterium]